MMLPVLLLAGLTCYAHADDITLTATPEVAQEGETESVQLECRLPSDGLADYKTGATLSVTKKGGGFIVMKTKDTLDISPANGTTAEGNLASTAADSGSTYLTVTISEPEEEDSGEYECSLIYVASSLEVKTIKAEAYLNVTGEEPPVVVNVTEATPVEAPCECDLLWAEIDLIKDALAERPASSAPAVAAAVASECQVSFSAHFATRHGYLILPGTTAMFDATKTNKGGAYDVTTGEFTAPCDGQYFFNVALRSFQEMDSGYVDGVLMADDEPVARTSVYIDTPMNNMQQAATGSVVALTKDQKVKVVVQTTSSGEFVGNEYSVFSGFYVSP